MNLVGRWKVDPSDRRAREELGEVRLVFEPSGQLITRLPSRIESRLSC